MIQLENTCPKLENAEALLEWARANPEVLNNVVRRRTKDGHNIEKKLPMQLVMKILSRVQVSDNGCWEWQMGLNGPGVMAYGVQWCLGKKFKCHQIFFQFFNGSIPNGLFICHKCDNPKCCNPNHLYAGTAKDNATDCASRGRMTRELGEERYNTRLTNAQVKEIKEAAKLRRYYGWGRDMALKYKTSRSVINNIISGFRWKHIQ